MNTMEQPMFQVSDLFGIFSKYSGMIIITTTLSVMLFAAVGFFIPKRYKTSFVLAIHSNYFQSPLTHDLTPTIYDTSEMRSQRESLIRQTLTLPFIDSLGEKYDIYQYTGSTLAGFLPHSLVSFLQAFATSGSPSSKDLSARSAERQDLISRIEVLNLSGDTFQISFIYSNPDVTYQVIQDIYNQVTQGLMAVRRNNMIADRDAIQSQLNSLAHNITASAEAAPPSTATNKPLSSENSQPSSDESVNVAPVSSNFYLPEDSQSIDGDLAEVRNEIRALSMRYTENHPALKELREKEKILSSMTGNAAGTLSNSTAQIKQSIPSTIPQDTLHDIYGDLMKKLNYLNISLESDQSNAGDYFAAVQSPLYPAAPLWPKRGLFALWGLAVGLVGSFFVAAICEYFDRTVLRTQVVSQQFGIPLLGKLPVVPWAPLFRIPTGQGDLYRELEAGVE